MAKKVTGSANRTMKNISRVMSMTMAIAPIVAVLPGLVHAIAINEPIPLVRTG
jgi:hypothetical protein